VNRKVHQITIMPRRSGGGTIELDHVVVKLLKWLPAGPTGPGLNGEPGFRKHTLVQFIAKHGGIRTCAVDDLIAL
jgi:hypothetical protein